MVDGGGGEAVVSFNPAFKRTVLNQSYGTYPLPGHSILLNVSARGGWRGNPTFFNWGETRNNHGLIIQDWDWEKRAKAGLFHY